MCTMVSPKFLFVLICSFLVCDSFKLHLNREVKEKSSVDKDRFKAKPLSSFNIKDEASEEESIIEESDEDVSEELYKIDSFKSRYNRVPIKRDDDNERLDIFDRKLTTTKDKEETAPKERIPEKVLKIDLKKDRPEVKVQHEDKFKKDITKSIKKEDEPKKINEEVINDKQNIDKTSKISQKHDPVKQTPKIKPVTKIEEIAKDKISISVKQKVEKEEIKKEEIKKQEDDKKEQKVQKPTEEVKKHERIDVKLDKKPKEEVKKHEQIIIDAKLDKKSREEKQHEHKITEEKEDKPTKDKEDKLISKIKEEVKEAKDENMKNFEGSGAEDGNGVDQEQFDILYRSLPSFAPDYSIVKNEECRQQGQIFLRQLRGHKLWALQMLDASAKLPSGILRGNLNQLGDFDSCLGASARVKVHQDKPAVPVKGKYCLAEMDLAAVAESARFPVHLMQARNFIRSNRKDPGHFIPKFTTVNWALCLPSACTHKDAEDMLQHAIAPYNVTTGVKISLGVKEDMCYTKKHVEWWKNSYETLATLGFYSFIIFISCLATLKDCWQTWSDVGKTEADEKLASSEKEVAVHNDGALRQIFMAFSIKRSGEELLKSGSADGEIECIHGIRAFTTLILYCAHKLLPLARIPFSNRTFLTEIANSQWSVILRVSLIYTDTFLLLSGVLSAYNMSKDMMNNGQISWFTRLITRYIRLTPALLAVLLFYAYVWDHIGSGPQWSNVVTANARLCKDNMWTNLLYIQNFFPFEEMCATHTHQLALDMQLTLLAPILVWFLYKRPIWGLALMGGFHSLSVGLRYFATLNNRLSLVIFHGMSLSQLMRTANFSYANALHRATPYLTGVGLGVLLKNTGKNMYMPKIVIALGWMGALYFFGWTFNAPAHLSKRDYQYDVEEAAQFSASASVAWSLALSWLIFACHTNKGGPINSLLCSRPLVLLSRISYATYLIQFIIFFYNVGTYRSSTVFDIMQSFDVLEFGTVILAAIIVTLLLDTPMQVIKTVIMTATSGSKTVSAEIPEVGETQEEIKKFIEDHEGYTRDEIEIEESHFAEHHDPTYQESPSPEPGEPSPERELLSEEAASNDPGSDLYDYEYEEDEEDNTEPTTERDLGVEDDQDLQDWEWTEDDKQTDEANR